MRLYDLFCKVSWKEVEAALKKIFKKHAYTKEHKKTFNNVLLIKPCKSKGMRICIGHDKDGYDVYGKNGKMLHDDPDFKGCVKGLSKKDLKDIPNIEVSWAIEYRPWCEWLGMDLDKSCFKHKIGDAGIVAVCLYEMCFAGYDEKNIGNHYKNLMAKVKAAKKQIAKNKA